jgi:hypothetical protein
MGQHGGSPLTGWTARAGRASLARAGIGAAAISAAVIGALAGCSSAGPASGSSAPAAQTTPGSATASSAGTPSVAAAAAFAPIVEPFDPGHPARTRPAPASCGGQPTTLAIERCYEARIENTDAAIDAVKLARYQNGSQARRAAITAGDSAWLSASRSAPGPSMAAGLSTRSTWPAACSRRAPPAWAP